MGAVGNGREEKEEGENKRNEAYEVGGGRI